MNDKVINEYIDMLLKTFDNYCNRPTWDKLQTMFCQILLLGIELGLKRAYINQQKKNAVNYERLRNGY